MPIALKLQAAEKPTPGKRSKVKEKEPFSEPAKPVQLASTVGKGHKILVVDDNHVVLKAFEMKLKSDGFEVATIDNAAAVASQIEQHKAELIILDINFPSSGAMMWSGFTVIQWLRHFPELNKVPIILISGSDSAYYADRALKAGAVAFFQKPVVYQDLLAAILKTLNPRDEKSA